MAGQEGVWWLNLIEQEFRRLTAEGRLILKLFSGNPNEQGFCFPREILERVYSQYFKVQGYRPHPKGLLKAREAIRDYYSFQGASVDSEDLILTSGTSESFFYLFSLLTKTGDNILAPNPAYPLFDFIAGLRDIELRHYRLDEEKNWSVDLQDLRSKTNHRTKAIIIVSPNNPTGAVFSAEEVNEITAWANQKEIPLICDEVFSEFYFGAGKFPRVISSTKPKLGFTLNGISKMFALPGLKLSWIAVTGEESLVEPAVDRLETIADTFLSCHIPIQEALPVIFKEGQNFLKSYRDEVRHRCDLAIRMLNQSPHIRFIEPAGGFYLMGEVRKDLRMNEEEFVIRLMKENGIFVHPGYFYDYEKGIHFVVSFLTRPDVLQQGLQALLQFVG